MPPPPPPSAVPPGGLPPDWAQDKLLFTQPPPGHVPIPPVMGPGVLPPSAVPPLDVSVKPLPVHPPAHQPQPLHPHPIEHDSNKFRDSYSDDRRDRKEPEFYDRTREPTHKPPESESRTTQPSELAVPKTGEGHDASVASSDIRPRDKSYSHGDRLYPTDLDASNIKDKEAKKEVERAQDRENKKSDQGYEGSRDEREPSAPRSPSIKATSPGPMPDRVRIEEAEPGLFGC